MNLLVGSGAIRLKTDEFDNQEPDGLQVSDELSMIVLEPIPQPPPEIVQNNVQSINFFNVPISGFRLSQNLSLIERQSKTTFIPLSIKIKDNDVRILVNNQWIKIQSFIWDGQNWSHIEAKVFNGSEWV
jgi:hypothetical protein